MAEPLKNSFGADVPRTIARMIAAVSPRFNEQAFIRSAHQHAAGAADALAEAAGILGQRQAGGEPGLEQGGTARRHDGVAIEDQPHRGRVRRIRLRSCHRGSSPSTPAV